MIIGRLSMAVARVLASDPAVRFVQELHVHGTMGEIDNHSELFELIGSPLLANLRVFQMGDDVPSEDGWCDCGTYVPDLEHVLAGMSRVEVLDLYCKAYRSGPVFALTNLSHLRELRMYHLGGRGWRSGDSPVYALDVFAKNPAFANLTHLLFHPHQAEERDGNFQPMSYIPLAQVRALVRSPHLKKLTHLQLRMSDMGDEGIREIIASGILKQLVWLDLQSGCVTDEGAKLLAAYPDAKRLDRINLSRNGVSTKGLAALRKAGVSGGEQSARRKTNSTSAITSATAISSNYAPTIRADREPRHQAVQSSTRAELECVLAGARRGGRTRNRAVARSRAARREPR